MPPGRLRGLLGPPAAMAAARDAALAGNDNPPRAVDISGKTVSALYIDVSPLYRQHRPSATVSTYRVLTADNATEVSILFPLRLINDSAKRLH